MKEMSLLEQKYKQSWYVLLCIFILYELLACTRYLLTYFHIEEAKLLSHAVIYLGVILLVALCPTVIFLKKRFPVSNSVLYHDKLFMILFVIVILLGLVIYLH